LWVGGGRLLREVCAGNISKPLKLIDMHGFIIDFFAALVSMFA